MLVAIKPVCPSSVYENKDYIMLHIWHKIAVKSYAKTPVQNKQNSSSNLKFKNQVQRSSLKTKFVN